MGILEDISERAKAGKARIVLSEGEDPRIIEGAIRAEQDGLCAPILVGQSKAIRVGLSEKSGVAIIDPETSDWRKPFAEMYHDLRKHKGMTLEKAQEAIRDPLVFSAMMVRCGHADATIGGAVATTGDTIRAALQVIGMAPGMKTVSSFFLMILDQPHHQKQGVLAFADCALIVDPSAAELAEIATSTADSFAALVGTTPQVAMLSFSTAGSATHPRAQKVQAATQLARSARADLAIDGELQFDTAFVPHIAAAKAPDALCAGNANVFVFPSLEAGNIGYKIAQRIGGATAIGPILQGLARPANDLSRGCSVEDIYHLLSVTAVQVHAQSRAESGVI